MNAKHTHRLPLFSLAAVALALALPACQQDQPSALELDADAQLDADAPRSGELPCITYCQARADQMRDRCELDGHDAALCAELAGEHAGACAQTQCSLVVELPGPAELEDLARVIGHQLLGEDYEIVATIPHYWDGESVGSRVHIYESAVDQSRGFVEMGATLELPPVITYGRGEVAEVTLEQRALDRLTEFYGPQNYQLVRRHFTAIHPVLEYASANGSFFYNVAGDDVSAVFEVVDDPEADPEALMIRQQSFLRQWDRYLTQPFE